MMTEDAGVRLPATKGATLAPVDGLSVAPSDVLAALATAIRRDPQAFFASYRCEVLHEEDGLALNRGARADGEAPILALSMPDDVRTGDAAGPLRNELALADVLEPDWAVQPVGVVQAGSRSVLIRADPGGSLLSGMMAAPLEVASCLMIALDVVAALGKLHDRSVVHRRVHPSHVLVDALGRARLTGFGWASRLPVDGHAPRLSAGLAEVAYMAPEQTGRVDRAEDARSDLYALGIVVYEMLAGRPPFLADDLPGLIHSQVARPPPPIERADLPPTLMGLVSKLLAKVPEDRYQSALGVELDLRFCLDNWRRSRRVPPLELGLHDHVLRLLAPDRLHGRDEAVEAIASAFDEVARTGRTRLLLVSGPAGIGKTALVAQLRRHPDASDGPWVQAKFDQGQLEAPYTRLGEALAGLVRPILAAPDADLEDWRGRLDRALGGNAGLMAALVPDLQVVLGRQESIPDLPPQEAQNRLDLAVRRFLGCFGSPGQTLVLFLDDLQWADVATLGLLERTIAGGGVRHLLLVGTYRDAEVDAAHPLRRAIETLERVGRPVAEVRLDPLPQACMALVVGDTLACGADEAQALAELINGAAGGNPFFAIELLRGAVGQGLVRFDRTVEAWAWDAEAITAGAFAGDVVDLLSARVAKLGARPREALIHLAFVGAAEAADLAALVGCDPSQLDEAVREAADAGLVLRRGQRLAFAHDRVQEACRALVAPEDRPGLHLRIGRALRASLGPDPSGDGLIGAVRHLNRGLPEIGQGEEREDLFRLNAVAGRLARKAVAYASAREFYAVAVSPEALRGRAAGDGLDLLLALAEAQYLCGDFTAAEATTDDLLARADGAVDRSRVFGFRSKLFQVSGRFDAGLQAVLQGLAALGVNLPTSDEVSRQATSVAFTTVRELLGGRAVEALADLPVATDARTAAIVGLLVDAIPCIYIVRPELFPVVVTEAVALSIRQGNTDRSSFAYAAYALMLVSLFEEIEIGTEFSDLAMKLNAKFPDVGLTGAVLQARAAHILIWRKPFAAVAPLLDEALAVLLEAGDLIYAGALAFMATWQEWERGSALGDVLDASRKYAAVVRSSNNQPIQETIRLEQAFFKRLMLEDFDPADSDGELVDEAELLRSLEAASFGCGVVYHHVMTQVRHVLFGRHREALAVAAEVEPRLGAVMAMPIEATFHFLHALSLASFYPEAQSHEREAMGAALREKHRRLGLWATHCPANFEARHALVSAELARIAGDHGAAEQAFEAAIRSAGAHGLLHVEALASECAAAFYADRGLAMVSDACLRRARDCYARWGAGAKVADLEAAHPHLAGSPSSAPLPARTSNEHLDLATVVKVSEAISGAVVREALIDTLMQLALQTAGADHGLLALCEGGGLVVEAEARLDGNGIEVTIDRRELEGVEAPEALLRATVRTRRRLVIDDAVRSADFGNDAYIRRMKPRSLLCLPLNAQGKLIGVLFLENCLTAGAFTDARLTVLDLVGSQAATAFENAKLYAELRRSEAFLAEGQRISRCCTWSHDLSSDAMEWSEEAYRIWNFDPSVDSTFDVVRERIHPDDRELFKGTVSAALDVGADLDFEFRILLPDGSTKHLWTIARLDVLPNRQRFYVGSTMDITERKAAEAALLKAQGELAHAARVALLGELTASIAHEVLQPLAGIVTNGEAGVRWLSRSEPNIGKALSSLDAIVADAHRTGEVVHRLRAMSRKEAPRVERIPVAGVVADAVGLVGREVERHGIALGVEVEGDAPLIEADRIQIQQVLVNLVMNAMQAIEAVSSDGRRPEAGRITIRAFSPRPGVARVEVRDTGCGIPDEEVGRLFDTFYTTRKDGLGLGLTICRSIVGAHGGSVSVARNGERGTVVGFELPALAEG